MKIRTRKNLFFALLTGLFIVFTGIAMGRPISSLATDGYETALGIFSVDGYTGLLVDADNTDGEAFDFTITAKSGKIVSVAENTGSVLLLPQDAPAYWAEQTIPAGFKGTMLIPFSAKTVGQWAYQRYNKVFSKTLEGEMEFVAESLAENVDAFLSATLVDETEEAVLTANTSLPGELFEKGGKYETSVAPLLQEEYSEQLLVKGNSKNAWFRVHDVHLASTNGTYGVAFRIKNTSSEILRMQLFLMDEGGVEYTTARWYDYATDGYYLTFLHTDGSTSKIYNKENFTPQSSSASYLHIPANADGVLIVPWNMFLNYNGYYTFSGFTPTKGTISGKIDSVNHFRLQLKNSAETQAWESGFFLGSFYSVNMDGSMSALTNPGENYQNAISTFGKGGVHSSGVAGFLADTATIVMPRTEGVLATANGFTVQSEGYAFLGDELVFSPQYGYAINEILLENIKLSKNAEDLYTYKITAEDLGKTLVFKADMQSRAYSLCNVDVTGKTGLVFSVNNEHGEAFDFTVKAVNGATVRTAAGTGSVLMLPENGTAYWSAQTVPANFKGKVYLPFNAAAAEGAGFRNNPVFDGEIAGSAEFALYVEKTLSGTIFAAENAVDAAQEINLLAQTTFSPALFEKNGVYYEAVSAANGEYKKEGVKIQGKFAKANQWVKLRGMNLQTTDGTLGLAMRITNLSSERLPFKLFAVTFNNSEVGTQREIGYDNELFYLLFVHTDGRVEKLTYESNGYFFLPAAAEGTVVLPWNMMLGYQGIVTDSEKTGADSGRIDSVYLLRLLHGKDISSDKTWNEGFILGSVYTVNADGSMTKVYVPAERFPSFLFSQTKAEKYATVKITCNENYEGGSKITSPAGKYYVGDSITVTANDGYALKSVTAGGVALAGEQGVYTYTLTATDTKLTLDVVLEERMAIVSVTGNLAAGFDISRTGKVAKGTVITVSPQAGYTVTDVKVNGQPLTAENGVYSYIVQESDIHTELVFAVVVKVTTANVTFSCDRLGGAQITAIGPLNVGTVVTIRQNEGFTVLKVEKNGIELAGENGTFSYIIQASDVGTDVNFVVTAVKGTPTTDSMDNNGEQSSNKSGCSSSATGVGAFTLLALGMAFVVKRKNGK